jgi:hypothetical protein
MATTDAKAGFRLPWSSDRSSTDASESEQLETADATAQPTEQAAASGWPSNGVSSQAGTAPTESPEATTETVETTSDPSAEAEAEPFMVETESATEPAARITSGKKPSKFLADLTKAMQTAAEDARSLALSQLQADAKNHIEQIHARSSTEAADLRRVADDDVAAVREWSKAEIARIREETEARITERKGRLESEIDEHAAVIEREIDAVQKTVAAFEDEMAAFFERLLGEEDPSRFATMAENLPEAPSFEGIVAEPAPVETTDAETEVEAAVTEAETEVIEADVTDAEAVEAEAVAETVEDEPNAEMSAGEVDTSNDEAETATGEAETTNDDGIEPAVGSVEGYEGGEGMDGEVDREAAFAAIQAAAEAAASAEVAADAAARAEAVADVAIEIMGNHEDEGEADPRFAALGLSPDYDAAEAEAYAAAGSSDEEIAEIDDDALAARLAGLVPGKSRGNAADTATTQIVVVGLVSVASIASFKRHLGRVPGVQSVGVSSGPDGEFVFAVKHGGDVLLRDAIPSLPSFQARVTGSADGVVHVTAHDPEGDA